MEKEEAELARDSMEEEESRRRVLGASWVSVRRKSKRDREKEQLRNFEKQQTISNHIIHHD